MLEEFQQEEKKDRVNKEKVKILLEELNSSRQNYSKRQTCAGKKL